MASHGRKRAVAMQRAGKFIAHSSTPCQADYLERLARYGLSARHRIERASQMPGAVWLDCRSEDEVAALRAPILDLGFDAAWIEVPETDAARLEAEAPRLLPDRAAPVICFCTDGVCARTARGVLMNMGYRDVLNAGGCRDLYDLVLHQA